MKRPLVACTLMFCLGIVVERCFRLPFAALYGSALCFCAAGIVTRNRQISMVLLGVMVCILGMASWRNNWTLASSHIIRLRGITCGKTYAVRGWVASEPRVTPQETSFVLETHEVASRHLKHPCCGRMRVIIRGEKQLAYGQELALEGRLHRPFGRYQSHEVVFFILRVLSPTQVSVLNDARGSRVVKLALALKSKIEGMLKQRLSPISASVTNAMVLGEQNDVPAAIYRSMIKTGTVHILVVSGSNVGVVCFICVVFLKLLRIPRRGRILICVPLLFLYCLTTGASDPVVRATIMAVVFFSAYFVRRDADIYNSCAIAALVILMAAPDELFNVGFQLSFASVLAIVFVYPRLRTLAMVEKLSVRPLAFMADSCLVSLSAWLGTAGIIAYNFKMVSPVTVLANLFIVPLATLITLSSVSLIIAEFISCYLALSFAPAVEFLVNLLIRINAFMVQIPYAYFYLGAPPQG